MEVDRDDSAPYRLDSRQALILVALTLGALALRLFVGWSLPLRGDEVGTWIFMARDYRFLLTSFIDPWLSMGPYIALTKAWAGVVGWDPLALRLPVVAAGALAVPMTVAVALRLRVGVFAALAAGALVAANPYLVQFSVTLRSYSFLVLFVLMAWHGMLCWFDRPSWRHGGYAALASLLALLAHAHAVYALAAIALLAGLAWLGEARRLGVRSAVAASASLVLPVGAAIALAACAYLPIVDEMAAFKRAWSGPSPSPPDYLPWMFGEFFASGWLVLPAAGVLLAGWIAAVRHQPAFALVITLGVGVPVAIYAATGGQHFPWGATRFMIFVLPLLLIQVGWGICSLARTTSLRGVWLALVIGSWLPGLAALQAIGREHPWREVAETLLDGLQPQDAVVVPGNDKLALMPFFADRPGHVMLPAEYPVDGTGTGRLFLVVPEPWSSPRNTFRRGAWMITVYDEGSPAANARALVADVMENVRTATAPHLVFLLRDTLVLMDNLGWGERDRILMQRKYYHALINHPMGTHIPSSQRALRYP